MSKLKLAGGLFALLVALALYAILGGVSMATTALVIGGGLYLLGWVTAGTAQAIAIWLVGIGAVGGIIMAFLHLLILAD